MSIVSYYLGLDIGGSNLKLGLVSEADALIALKERKSGELSTEEQLMEKINEMVIELLIEENISADSILAMGVGVPGYVDNDKGIILNTNNLSFYNYPFRDNFKQLPDVPIFLGNDANFAALTESRLGAGRRFKNQVMLTLGTGVGGGIIIDGRLYTGFNNAASELGHHVLRLNGVPCTCGRQGCFEVYASATALIRMTREAIHSNPASGLAQLVKKQDGIISGKTAFLAEEQGDPTGGKVVSEYIRNLAEGCANIINILMPELIILGGGISQSGEDFLRRVAEISLDLAYLPAGYPLPKFALAEMGSDSGVIGAALFAADNL